MPGFNRTGPEGKGPQTGRKLGECNPKNKSIEDNRVDDEPTNGAGLRRGRGEGNGLRLRKRSGKGYGEGRELNN